MMNQNKLFQQTRLSLAGWYAGVMGLILSLCGLGVYQAILHAHWMTLDREIQSVAGTLHDSLEPVLKQPGKLEPEVRRFLPDLCMVNTACSAIQNQQRHALGAIHQGNYYVRLLNLSDQLVAVAGIETQDFLLTEKHQNFQVLRDQTDTRYYQISVALHTETHENWGWLQLGRSIKDFDDYLGFVKLSLFLGFPLALLLVGGAAWWLAGIAIQPIYQSYQQIQQFTADAAHELRTPLAALGATVESTLRMKQINELDFREILKSVERQNQRLSQLVKDLLFLSRLDQNRLLAQSASCALEDLISDVEEEIAVLALQADVTLFTEHRNTEKINLIGDAEQLYRMIFNLVSNAIQYTNAGGSVKIILDKVNNSATISIQDTGIGIPLAEQKQIFDRFYRVSNDRSRHTGGSGLGLAIALAIAKAHRGSIQVQSQVGKGSTFTVRLPL